jgi:hypothetical protein
MCQQRERAGRSERVGRTIARAPRPRGGSCSYERGSKESESDERRRPRSDPVYHHRKERGFIHTSTRQRTEGRSGRRGTCFSLFAMSFLLCYVYCFGCYLMLTRCFQMLQLFFFVSFRFFFLRRIRSLLHPVNRRLVTLTALPIFTAPFTAHPFHFPRDPEWVCF